MTADYAVLIAARNEEALIGTVLDDLANQEQLPLKVLVVSDGSTDGTEDVVRTCAGRWPFIELLRRPPHPRHDFAGKVRALNEGFARLRDERFDILAVLDADVSFGPEYFKGLLRYFEEDPRLGLAAGTLYEKRAGVLVPVLANRAWSVCGALQTFRRACFEEIGGYLPLRSGEDAVAEVMSRQAGWKVRTLPDLRALHLRPIGSTAYGSRCAALYASGVEAYELGYDPLFFTVRCAARSLRSPLLVGALCALGGFLASCLVRPKREVSPAFIRRLRAEQRGRMLQALGMKPKTEPGHEGGGAS